MKRRFNYSKTAPEFTPEKKKLPPVVRYNGFTPEQDEKIIAGMQKNLSYSEIGAGMAKTRGQVAGRVMRLRNAGTDIPRRRRVS